jgi:hypothetical protein
VYASVFEGYVNRSAVSSYNVSRAQMSALRDHERIGRYSNLEWFSKIGGEQETNLYT